MNRIARRLALGASEADIVQVLSQYNVLLSDDYLNSIENYITVVNDYTKNITETKGKFSEYINKHIEGVGKIGTAEEFKEHQKEFEYVKLMDKISEADKEVIQNTLTLYNKILRYANRQYKVCKDIEQAIGSISTFNIAYLKSLQRQKFITAGFFDSIKDKVKNVTKKVKDKFDDLTDSDKNKQFRKNVWLEGKLVSGRQVDTQAISDLRQVSDSLINSADECKRVDIAKKLTIDFDATNIQNYFTNIQFNKESNKELLLTTIEQNEQKVNDILAKLKTCYQSVRQANLDFSNELNNILKSVG